VYVSLAPGTVPDGVTATITNRATGRVATAALLNGGFDPISIGADVDDTVDVAITRPSPATTIHASLRVEAARRPRIVRTNPPHGGRDVPLNATIVIVFSAPIDSATVNTGTLQLLQDSTAVFGSVGFADTAHLQGQFQPTSLLAPLTTYTLVVADTIRDLNGSMLDSTAEVSFTTGANPRPATSFVLSGLPSSVARGTAVSGTINATDDSGNIVPGYIGTVHFTSSDPAAQLPADHTFTPADHGSYAFTITFMTGGTQTLTAVDLARSSVIGRASVAVQVVPRFSASPTSVVFGNQTVGTTSAPQTVTLTNNGSAAEPIETPINGYNGSDFAEASDCPSELGAGASCTISITFTPTARGSRTGLLVLNDGDYQAVMASFDATGTGGLSMAVAPDRSAKVGKFVYVANSGSDNISMYGISPTTGTLTPLVPPRIAAGSQPASVAVDPSGRFAYVANFGSNDVSMFAIDSETGALTPIAPPMPAGSGPVSVAVAPDPSGQFGKFVYVVNTGSDDVSMYAMDSTTGILTPIGSPVTAHIRPASMAVHPSGKFAYVATDGCLDGFNHYLNECLLTYAIDATTGILTSGGMTIPDGTIGGPSIAIDPSGRLAAMTDGAYGLSMFSVNATTGAVTKADYVSLNHSPTAVAIDPSARFAYVTTAGVIPCSWEGCSGVWMYNIDPNGYSTFKGTIGAGLYPTAIAIDPSGQFVYVANTGSQSVSIYSIGPDGTLTPIATIGT
jgi:DNA-binding beta-propeller fold protein YncE